MSELTKYRLWSAGFWKGISYADSHIEVDSQGEWVKAADVEALKHQLAETHAHLEAQRLATYQAVEREHAAKRELARIQNKLRVAQNVVAAMTISLQGKSVQL